MKTKRQKKMIQMVIITVSIVLISNLGITRVFIDGIGSSYNFKTEHNEFQFSVIESKGRDVDMMERNFTIFKTNNEMTKDTLLYRTFKRNPLKFWNWYEYIVDEKYKYPYMK